MNDQVAMKDTQGFSFDAAHSRSSPQALRIAAASKRLFFVLPSLAILYILQRVAWTSSVFRVLESSVISLPTCPIQSVIHPTNRADITSRNVEALFPSSSFKEQIAQQLSGAVQIPTICYDEMGAIGQDTRWEIFYELGRYLQETFPLVYDKLDVATVNEHGLLFTWQGSDTSLKPLLLMAHQDVVPVPNVTLERWTYPPFSGHYDGTYVWGRGSEDDKSNLVAILAAFAALLEAGFEPSRTVLFSVGFDEEGGFPESYGAKALAALILKLYGHGGIELIFDEGIAGIENHFGTEFAMPATAEKGYVDVTITVNTKGGHSSTPPDHTAIGYLADVIKAVESNPFPSSLTEDNPTTTYLSCVADYGKDVPPVIRDSIRDPRRQREVIQYLEKRPDSRALIRTSVAVDVVAGGSKANNLPESAYILVNHRIAIDHSVATVKTHYADVISPIAARLNFSICGFDYDDHGCNEREGSIYLSARDELEPSPVTSSDNSQFNWLTGTLRGVFGDEVVVAPVLLSGNTDTQFYWNLSSHIYRMSPWRASLDSRGTNMHTVDERMPILGLLEMIHFYHEFLRVVDEMRS
ncbi:hypothetical protein BP6252_08187 [Coleophoma cylindrospora]|uniref:Peptidase M20 dimerisation domain-containing protein n=1 Tax=Coleophoma cylindrospora TaxID=1849047 RepID=A0A3D8RCM5_9HELO|nr:hypothetical protein BP6252_08187 [Coleophoma cylindrospora]